MQWFKTANSKFKIKNKPIIFLFCTSSVQLYSPRVRITIRHHLSRNHFLVVVWFYHVKMRWYLIHKISPRTLLTVMNTCRDPSTCAETKNLASKFDWNWFKFSIILFHINTIFIKFFFADLRHCVLLKNFDKPATFFYKLMEIFR